MRMSNPSKWMLTLIAAGALSACGGSGPAINEVPPGITTLSTVAYRATAPGTGTTAETQDLLTAGLGKTGLGAARCV